MRNKLMSFAVGACLLGPSLFAPLRAEEVTGRQFAQIVQELNQELAEARKKVKALEAERSNRKVSDSGKILPRRQEELSKLREYSQRLKDTTDPQKKKEYEKRVQQQITRVAEVSADYIEQTKDDILYRDRQLQIMEEALAGVIVKLERLTQLHREQLEAKKKKSAGQVKVEARRQLQNLARVVEQLARKYPKAENWNRVRQTIMLQNSVLSRQAGPTDKLYAMLKRQKAMYEQAHTQIVLTRQRLAEQRNLLAQVALGEVARSMLRKAANLLLGEFSLDNFGLAALEKTDAMQKSLIQFINQDDASVFEGMTEDEGTYSDATKALPSGYAEFLTSKIE